MMSKGDVRVGTDALKIFSCALFERVGVSPEDARIVADVLVWANLRGVDSHGMLRIPNYVRWAETGVVNPRARPKVIRETPAASVVDGELGYGAVVLSYATERAIEKARKTGVGWVAVTRSTHSGAVGYYTLMCARAGMAGLYMGASMPNMAYHGVRGAGVSTNPIAISVPGGTHPPLMLDMATAVASVGKLKYHADANIPLPEGWALDGAGDPTTDPQRAVTPMPLGGPKGAGLALMFECMASLLVGRPVLEPRIAGRVKEHEQAGVIVAIDIAQFTDPADYRRNVDALVAALKAMPRAEGFDDIAVPGEHGDAILRERKASGIPLPAGTWKRLAETAGRLGVQMPVPL